MAFCKNCGAELKPEHNFCGNCGAPVKKTEETEKIEITQEAEEKINEEAAAQSSETLENEAASEQGTYEAPETTPISDEVFQEPERSGKLDIAMLVWAIANTVFSFCSCCLPIGILPLVFAIMTNNANYDVSRKNKKRALITNIIVTALIVLITVLEIVLMVLYADVLDQWLIEYSGNSYDLYY